MLAEHYALPVDVIVRTEDTLEQWKDVPGSFSRQVSSEGVILYENNG